MDTLTIIIACLFPFFVIAMALKVKLDRLITGEWVVWYTWNNIRSFKKLKI